MKTIRTLTVLFCFLLFSKISYARIIYINTPYGSQVEANIYPEMSQNDINFYTNQCKTLYPNIQVIQKASATYNCHAYAWFMSEGGYPTCWINEYPDLHYFMDDGSYKKVANEYQAHKIYYYYGDHSAVNYSGGKYLSKWGSWPLVVHAPDYCPYDTDRLDYYENQYLRKLPGRLSIEDVDSLQVVYTDDYLEISMNVLSGTTFEVLSENKYNYNIISISSFNIISQGEFFVDKNRSAQININNLNNGIYAFIIYKEGRISSSTKFVKK